jgi:hypothetical protein
MGGWCATLREQCSHYRAENRPALLLVERMCQHRMLDAFSPIAQATAEHKRRLALDPRFAALVSGEATV